MAMRFATWREQGEVPQTGKRGCRANSRYALNVVVDIEITETVGGAALMSKVAGPSTGWKTIECKRSMTLTWHV
jgi:hypothetical protein